MKTLFLISSIILISLISGSCSNNSNPTSNNNPPPCVKFDTLVSPPNDTLYSWPPNDSIRFKWLKATCTPVLYHFQGSRNPDFQTYVFTYNVSDTTLILEYGNLVQYGYSYWRVKAFYGSPISDSVTSSYFRIRYQ